MTNVRDDEALVAELGEAARRIAAAEAGEGPPPAAWRRLQEARSSRAPGGRRRAWTLAAVAAVAITGGVLVRRPHPLAYVVSGGQVEANGYLRGADDADTELSFSDGTRIHLARGARILVGTPGAHGARLRVEDGEARFEVAHRPGADWTVEVGPYRVQVVGTVFDVRWAGDVETATVTLRAGAVRVAGPHLAAPITLQAGQRLVARVPRAEVRIEQEHEEPATPRGAPTPPSEAPLPREAPPPAAAAPAAKLRERARRPSEPEPRAFQPEGWADRVARGDAAGVLAEARAASLDGVLATAPGPALGALADAARYGGDPPLASRVLRELRRRFPTSREAPGAAFLLGRMADDGGDANAALGWYRRYRDEAPRGPYAAEALGREMLAVERVSGRAAAAVIARDYLTRFPEGTYLLQARAILGTQ